MLVAGTVAALLGLLAMDGGAAPGAGATACDAALGSAPLGVDSVRRILDPFGHVDAGPPRTPLSFDWRPPAPGSGRGGPPALPREVNRFLMSDGRCAVWLATSEEPGAPDTTVSGLLAIVERNGTKVTVDAAIRFEADESQLGWSEQHFGSQAAYVVPQQHVGSGANEESDSACIWFVAATRIATDLCYVVKASWDNPAGNDWAGAVRTVAVFEPGGLLLRSTITWSWTHPAKTVSYQLTRRYDLRDSKLAATGKLQPLPADVKRKVARWGLPPLPDLPFPLTWQ